jgi:hypothetical protein
MSLSVLLLAFPLRFFTPASFTHESAYKSASFQFFSGGSALHSMANLEKSPGVITGTF